MDTFNEDRGGDAFHITAKIINAGDEPPIKPASDDFSSNTHRDAAAAAAATIIEPEVIDNYEYECDNGDDPNSTALDIGFDGYIPSDGNWERYGKGIGRNARLKELLFYDLDEEVMRGDFGTIFRGISHSRSIRSLSFRGCGLYDRDVFGMLARFFKNNENFECLKIHACDLGSDGIGLLASALGEFGSLKEFELSHCGTQNKDDSYIQGLAGHTGLKKLNLCGSFIGKDGCAGLAVLLNNPKSEIAQLTLAGNGFDNEMAAILAKGMAGNNTLKHLDLSRNPLITEAGWSAIFATIGSRLSFCKLERLSLQESRIDDTAAQALANALAKNQTLKALDMSCCQYVLEEGWRAMFKFLKSPSCKVEELHLPSNNFSDNQAASLAYSLAHTKSLKSLDLSANHGIAVKSWRSISLNLRLEHTVLENLCLSSNMINDEAIQCITSALYGNRTLRSLKLCNNPHITTRGWLAFSNVFQSPTSALEKVDVSCNHINDVTMISFATSLANNKTLVELKSEDSFPNISGYGWAAISHVLCNKSSIADTYRSNHTLQRLCHPDFEFALPTELSSHLALNRENGNGEAARLKILYCHFDVNDSAMQLFMEMRLGALPDAIAWMGRDALACGGRSAGLSLLYRFVQTIPLFLMADNGEKLQDVPRSKRRKLDRGHFL